MPPVPLRVPVEDAAAPLPVVLVGPDVLPPPLPFVNE